MRDPSTQAAFNPSDIDDARTKTFAAIVRRQGQPIFRRALIDAYVGRCAITGCDLVDVLEAAHIIPYQGPRTNHITNGLLLRADIHTLFDLGLIAVESKDQTVIVAPSLIATDYGKLHGKKLRLPDDARSKPSLGALRHHRTNAGL